MRRAGIIGEFIKSDRRKSWIKHRLLKKIAESVYEPLEKNDGVRISERDWDNLLILDACRYDTFAKLEPELDVKGELSKVKSRGTRTVQFLRENFEESYQDTVYVSVNPFVLTVLDNPFYETIYVEETQLDKEAGAIRPETVVEEALEANRRHPQKRLIIHFLQPHHPFIGETRIEREFKQNSDGTREKNKNPWRLFARGELSEAELRQAYEDNLRRVFPAIEELVGEIDGKTVLTSDHGESFGTKAKHLPLKIYGHGGPRISPLIDVPWYEFEFSRRKSIVSGEAEPEATVENADIDERLRSLGYRE